VDDARKTTVRDPRGRLLETWETEETEEDESERSSDAALRAAYRDHERYLNDAYKTGASPPGAYPHSAAAEGAARTINGAPGHPRRRRDGALVCVPDRSTDVAPEEGDVYGQYNAALRDAWRHG